MIVSGIRSSGSVGIERYTRHLSAALRAEGIDYRCVERPARAHAVHFHLANSSRRALLQAPSRRDRYVVTVHDVEPRTKALAPLYAHVAYPLVVARAAKVIVHSEFAADLLRRHIALRDGRLTVIPHAAPTPRIADRAAARAELGWDGQGPIAVLPGAARSVKLVHEAIDAAARSGWRLVLVGDPRDPAVARRAAEAGVVVLRSPDDAVYEAAVAASDLVLVLRRGTVGETNGPLLDALGAGRAVLATRTGSIPEVARGAAAFAEPTVDDIASRLGELRDPAARRPLEKAASAAGAAVSWSRAAHAHRRVFEETFG
jgi:glycosyltransferase involved in cell wall biosynthesis